MSDAPVPLAVDTVVFARRLRTRGLPALVDIDLEILPGEIFVIVGRPWAGKTALLEAFVGLRPVSADQLAVCGADPSRFPRDVKRRIGVAIGRAEVERGLRVAEALTLFATFYATPVAPDRVLDQFDLRRFAREPVHRLPPWAAQLFSLALALVHNPVILFVDDPTRDLDPAHAHHIWQLLKERRANGFSTVMTSNNLEETERLADRVCLLDAGRIVAVDSPAGLIATTGSPVRVIFEVRKRPVAVGPLAELPGATAAHVEGETYIVSSRDGFATLRALIRHLERLNIEPATLLLKTPTLREAFLNLMQPGGAP